MKKCLYENNYQFIYKFAVTLYTIIFQLEKETEWFIQALHAIPLGKEN